MIRTDIISKVGRKYLVANIENDEFSYAQGLSNIGKNHIDYLVEEARRKYKDLDIRFVMKDVSLLIETKPKLKDSELKVYMEQLQQYQNVYLGIGH